MIDDSGGETTGEVMERRKKRRDGKEFMHFKTKNLGEK